MPDPSGPLKIIIADDHALVRGGLSLLVRSIDPESVTIECNDFDKVTSVLQGTESIDLLLIDLLMPGMNLIESIEQICARWPDLPVIVVSVKEDMHLIQRALRAGASGYIPKTHSPDVTLNAIRLVLSGGIYVPPDALELKYQGELSSPNVLPDSLQDGEQNVHLTSRQIEVLTLIAEGNSTQEIGEKLGLSTATIKMHLGRIYKALDAKSRTDALAKYAKRTKAGG